MTDDKEIQLASLYSEGSSSQKSKEGGEVCRTMSGVGTDSLRVRHDVEEMEIISTDVIHS